MSINNRIIRQYWGEIAYQQAFERQTALHERMIADKLALRSQPVPHDYLISCSHLPVYTLGRNGDKNHLLIGEQDLKRINATFTHTNRGGDITFHGPGQLVVYPIVDLEAYKPDITWYIRTLEKAVIAVLADYGIAATYSPVRNERGVWIDPATPNARKICAIGVKVSRWVTMHGIALNVCPDMAYFHHIVPCGIADKRVTSVQQERPDLSINLSKMHTQLLDAIAESLTECT